MGDQLKFVQLEMMVVALGLLVLIADLAMAPSRRRLLGYLSAAGLFVVFLLSFRDGYTALVNERTEAFFNSRYKVDGLALFFKRFFLIAGIFVLVFAVDFSERLRSGMAEFSKRLPDFQRCRIVLLLVGGQSGRKWPRNRRSSQRKQECRNDAETPKHGGSHDPNKMMHWICSDDQQRMVSAAKRASTH